MAEFLVIRHAEDVSKSDDLPYLQGSIDTYLSALGQRQAEGVATALFDYGIHAVHAPPLLRTAVSR